MGRAFDLTYVVTQNVPYTFRCEHCGKNSGTLVAEFQGKAVRAVIFPRKIKEHEKGPMYETATELLRRRLQRGQRDAEKEIFVPNFKDKCPHCGSAQSWSLKRMRYLPVSYGMKGAFLAALLCVNISFFGVITTGTALKIGVIIGLICMVVGFVRLGAKKFETKTVQEKHIPQIDWPPLTEVSAAYQQR